MVVPQVSNKRSIQMSSVNEWRKCHQFLLILGLLPSGRLGGGKQWKVEHHGIVRNLSHFETLIL